MSVDNVHLVQIATSGHTSGGVLVQGSPVPSECKLFFDSPVVLTAEENDTSLGYEQCQLILLLIGKLTELDSFELGTDRLREVLDSRSCAKERFLVRVRKKSAVLGRLDGGVWLPVNVREGRLEIVVWVISFASERAEVIMLRIIVARTVGESDRSLRLDRFDVRSHTGRGRAR